NPNISTSLASTDPALRRVYRGATPRLVLDHTQAPLLDAMRAYHDANVLPFTVPGHKCGRGLAPEVAAALGDAFRHDIPLAGGADDLRMTRGVLAQAERLAADAFGARRCFFVVNGSSLSNQIALLSVAGSGDEV